MMKKIFLLFIAVIPCSLGLKAQEQRLDDILNKYYAANGLDKLQKVNTIIMKGLIVQNDAMPVKIVKMRPDKYLMEYDVADLTAYQAYDGKTAWMTTPWTGNMKPQVIPEERAKDIRNRTDFDGLLYDWKAKGHTAELGGTDTVNGTIAWKIKLTRKDGGNEYYSIDKNSFMILKKITYRMVRGKEAEVASYFRDYRDVEGIPFPFIIESSIDGQPYQSNQFDSIELNKPVDEKVFQMPTP
jgi:hypothetical protein